MHDVPDVRRQRRWQLGGLFVVLAVVVALAAAVGTSHAPRTLRPGSPVPGAPAVSALFAGLAQQGPTLGRTGAPVTLVEFGDLQCPACAQFARGVLPSLVRQEVRSGRLRISFRALDFIGSDSVRAARMALAAGAQNRLWEFIDLFYSNQRDENSGYASDAFLTALGDAIPGLDSRLALSRRNDPAVTSALAANRSQARHAGVRSTPSFLLGRTGGPLASFTPADAGPGSFTTPVERLAPPTGA